MPGPQSLSTIPPHFIDLLGAPHFAHLCTVNADGSPQSSPVWMSWDGTHILINTAEGRRKTNNMRRDPRVAISVRDEANGYRYMEIRGRVTELTHAGADAHINQLLKAYMGEEDYTPYRWSAEEVRVIAKIRPEHVVVWVE